MTVVQTHGPGDRIAFMVRKKKATLSKDEIEALITEWIHKVNEKLSLRRHPWTATELTNGRKVKIDVVSDAVLSGLRTLYFEQGWCVYAIISGELYGDKVERYLEFWKGKGPA